MELDEYQKKAMKTCLPESNNFAYMFLNFLGETGEMVKKVADETGDDELNQLADVLSHYGKLAKEIRKNKLTKTSLRFKQMLSKIKDMRGDKFMELIKELGDILWQLAGMHHVLDIKLESTAWSNLLKLADRQKRNVIDGEGDNR